MTSAGWATLDVIPSFKGFRSALDKGVSGDMATVGRTSGAKFGDNAGKAAGGRFASRFREGIKDIAAPVAGIFAGAAIVDTFKDAVAGASDLAESGNKIQAIFGDAQSKIMGFASDAATAFGQTRVQALDAAATFGTFGKAAGLSGGALAGFSEKLVGLSSDLASFYNTDPTQAIEAIGAALRGESEPIRAYGVLLDDMTLRQQALKMGLIDTTKQALTPQQRVLAAYQVILKQTTDAQGDFKRTSGGLANQQRILAAQWTEMKTNLGTKLLPAVVTFAHTMNDDVLPAVESAGGMVADTTRAFGSLPTPVKAAAGALVAFRIAAATGIGANLAAGLSSVGGAMASLRIRTMLAADAFRSARAGSIEFTGNLGRVTPSLGRFSSGLQAVRVGAMGAGTALKRGLGGAMSLLGGPWGIAIAAGTAAVAHFWSEHEKAKQYVDDLTASLDKQTGSVTDNTRELVYNSLQKSGAIDAAKRLGISLDLVREAAIHGGTAAKELGAQLAAIRIAGANASGFGPTLDDAAKLGDALGDAGGALAKAKAKAGDYADFMGKANRSTNDSTTVNSRASSSFRSLADRIADARHEVNSLANAENKRRLARVQAKRDEIALIETEKAAEQEAKHGKKTLDEQTKAGRDNWKALLDLADQWNNSKGSVQNARGAYKNMRDEFIKVAEAMGAGDTKAKRLADRLLKLPKDKKINITTPGMKQALEDLRKLQERVKSSASLAVYVSSHQANDPRLIGHNANGTDFWRGGPTWVGERGPEIVNLPRGASVTPNHEATKLGGNTYHVTVVADDPWAWKRDMDHMARAEAIGGADFR